MTITTPQWVNDPGDGSLTYDAGELRIMDTLHSFYDGEPLGSRTGVRPGGSGLQVTYTNTTWMIAPGIGAISAVASGAFGEYRFAVTSTESGSIQAPDASNPRKDILVLTVRDADNGDSSSEVVAQYVVGTPNATPTAPSVPAKSLLLATFTVPVAGSVSAVDERVYTVASGGILPTKIRPTSPALGATIYNLTSGLVETWNGTTWLALSGSAPITQVFSSGGTWTKPSGALWVDVEVQGGGGAGGGATASGSGQNSKGSGGGAGGYARKRFAASDLASTVSVTVGAGGTGLSGGDGGSGGASSFNHSTSVVGNGGSGGFRASAGATPFGAQGASGSSASGGDVNCTGGSGGPAWGDGSLGVSGNGGDAQLGGGAPSRASGAAGGSYPGISAGNYGGGGSGALSTSTGGAAAGGNGGPGVVIVRTYFR